MTTLLAHSAEIIVTMDDERREIAGGAIPVRDNLIEQIGPTSGLPSEADVVLDMSGCTTVFDHAYVWQSGSRVDDQIAAATEIGVRFHASRGSMSLGESRGGLPPDACVEDEDAILEDSQRVSCSRPARRSPLPRTCSDSRPSSPAATTGSACTPTCARRSRRSATRSNMLLEVRQAMLVARLRMGLRPPEGPMTLLSSSDRLRAEEWLTAREALEVATRGGAAVLGRDDIGHLAPGMYADFFSVDIGAIEFAGGLHDPVASVVFCAPHRVDTTVIDGHVVVAGGELATLELEPIIEAHNRLSREMARA